MTDDYDADAVPLTDEQAQHEEETRRHFWRNYLAHGIEGGLYMGGLAFIDPQTVLPPMVRTLGGAEWLIALTPVLPLIGMSIVPPLMAHRIERLTRVKRFVQVMGIFQRLPYLLAALVLIFATKSYPILALAAVALTPFISGLCISVHSSAWLELCARILPRERLASSWAIRAIMQALLGLLAGVVITEVLSERPGAEGYGVLHLIAFGFLALSFAIFALIRETQIPRKPPAQRKSLSENLRAMPGILRGDKRLRDFLGARVAFAGRLVVVPFLSIHALDVLGKSEGYLGYFVAADMVGRIVGNMSGGIIGDRAGAKILQVLARAGFVGVCFIAMLATAQWALIGMFALFGASFALEKIGYQAMRIEVAPQGGRPTYFAIMAFVSLPAWIISWGASSLIAAHTATLIPAASVAGLATVVSLLLLLRVRDPRREHIAR